MYISSSLLTEWHPQKNGTRNKLSSIPASTKVWWLGACGHEWDAAVHNRVSLGSGCPYCSGHKTLAGFNDLQTTHPELVKQWHPTKNSISANSISKGTVIKVWWLGACGHEWEASVNSRTNSKALCPYCAGQRVLPGFNDLGTTHPEIASQWHPTRNKPLDVTNVSRGSHTRVWWLGECGHEWADTVKKRALEGRTCHLCNGKILVLGFNDLPTTHPHLAQEWDHIKNHPLEPTGTKAGSGIRAWWICPKGHSYRAIINDRKNGSGCSVCDGKTLLPGFNDLETRHPALAREWHPTKNSFLPSEVITSSSPPVWWIGGCGHSWKTTPNSRLKGTGCPTCAPYGFQPDKPSYLYVIQNNVLQAAKIGITNTNTDRLQRWEKRGWTILFVRKENIGHRLKELESEIKFWLKQEGIKNELERQDVGNMGGWTETIPNSSELIDKIIKKIQEP